MVTYFLNFKLSLTTSLPVYVSLAGHMITIYVTQVQDSSLCVNWLIRAYWVSTDFEQKGQKPGRLVSSKRFFFIKI